MIVRVKIAWLRQSELPNTFSLQFWIFIPAMARIGSRNARVRKKYDSVNLHPKTRNQRKTLPDAPEECRIWVTGGERLRGEILARLAGDTVAKHPTRGHDAEQQGRGYGDEELRNTEDESEGSTTAWLVLYDRDVKSGTSRESKRDEKEE
jgi:hypothetical protein